MVIIKTTTNLSYGKCKAEEGKLPTRCRLKSSGYCKKHKGEHNIKNSECECPLDNKEIDVIIYQKVKHIN